MSTPIWFVLIQQWKRKGMGQYGITLPFLVGAMARARRDEPSLESISAILHEIVTTPVPGYVTEVRWCGQIDAPVFSVSERKAPTQMPFKSYLSCAAGNVSLGFSQDLQSTFGLDCSGASNCLEKLIAHAKEHVEAGNSSRVRNTATGKWEFGKFLSGEIQYIDTAIADAGRDG